MQGAVVQITEVEQRVLEGHDRKVCSRGRGRCRGKAGAGLGRLTAESGSGLLRAQLCIPFCNVVGMSLGSEMRLVYALASEPAFGEISKVPRAQKFIYSRNTLTRLAFDQHIISAADPLI